MKRILFFIVTLNWGASALHGQNIAINTTGNAAAAANMLEVIQPATALTDYVSIFAKNLSAGANGYAIWAEATGATSNRYALVVPYLGGSIGIGTTTPSRLLHIRSTPSSAEFFGMRISTDHDASDPVVELYHETANKGYRWRLGAAATSSLFLDYSTNSFAAYTTYMSVISNGYMGLGTQTPQAPLHIYSAAGADIWTTHGVNSTAGTDGLNLGYGGATWGAGQSFLNAHSTTAANGKLRFLVNWSDKMIILDNGNVGISTTAPVVKLDLGNASSNKPVFRLHPGTATAVDYSGGYAHHDLLIGSYATGGYSQHYISFGYTADANRKFHIGSGSNAAFDGTTTFVPAFTVASGGNVGVGASSPLTK